MKTATLRRQLSLITGRSGTPFLLQVTTGQVVALLDMTPMFAASA